MKKSEAGSADREQILGWRKGVFLFMKEIREASSYKVTCEQRPKGREEGKNDSKAMIQKNDPETKTMR